MIIFARIFQTEEIMKVSIQDIKKLKDMTGAGIKDCKNALKEAEGDFQKAIEILRKKGQKVLASRAGKSAAEGVVRIHNTGTKAIAVALNCETDFVAKTDVFQKLADDILKLAVEKQPASLEELREIAKPVLEEAASKIQEKLEISAYEILEGEKVYHYIHHNGKLATLIALENTDGVADLDQVGNDLAVQVAAMMPIGVDRDDIPGEIIQKEMEIARELAKNEGKPEHIIDKIAQGRVNKFLAENTLLNQEFFKEDKKKVKQYLKEKAPNLKVKTFKIIEIKAD